MRISIGQRIVLGFLVALVVLLAVGIASYRAVQELGAQRQWVLHTVQVLQQSESLFNRLSDSASLARGYALTGAETLRERFLDVAGEVNNELEQLDTLTADNGAQQQRLYQLKPLIVQRQEAARSVIELRDRNPADREARTAATVLQGAKIMDQIRVLIHEIESEERRLLAERQVQADAVEALANGILVYGTLAAALFIGLAAYFITASIRRPLVKLVAGAERIGSGDYASRVAVTSDDELGHLSKVFNEMAQQVEQRQLSMADQDWLNASLARFSRLFEGQRVLATLCQSLLSELASVLNARHSVIYTPQVTEGGVVLQLQASYACDTPPQRLVQGQGLAGQCFLDREFLLVRDVPKDYLKINSALGASAPASIVVLPAVFEGEIKAIVEIATFDALKEVQLTFLRKLGESLGAVLNTIAAAARTEELLAEFQALSERLQAGQQQLNERNHELEVQTERLRQSELRLQEQQMELKQTNEELEQSNEELQQTNAEMEDKQVLLEEQKRSVDAANRDVSEARLALEEKVRQLDLTSKYKSEFLANMSHELRTPLNSLLILSKVLSNNTERNLTDKQVQRAKAIHSSGNDLLELINDILDLSKIEAGSMDLDVEDMPVAELTQYIDATFRHMVEGKGLRFHIKVAEDTPSSITTDARRLQQILKNLIANATKFTERGGVTLSIEPATHGWQNAHAALDSSRGVVAFAVSDTGIGIPRDRQKIIFEAFQQADAGTSRKYGGTGLGLSISRELTQLLQGALTLQSQEKVGSTFTLYLPLQIESAPAPHRHESTATPRLIARHVHETANDKSVTNVELPEDDRETLSGGEQVLLVVEDDKNFARILADFAHDKGFKVLIAHTAESGIELARRYRPTAITLDLLLPDNDGWVVLDRIKHDPELQHIPMHVISVDEQRERSLKLGAVSYLQKPVTSESIERALSQTIDFVNRSIKRLLIVEDDAIQRQSIVELIGNGDVHATAVGTASEALQALHSERFDCVVLDLGLPDMAGADLIATIQQRLGPESPPIVIYTGKSLTRKEETELRRLSEAIIVKDVSSPERLLAETALFLHRVQAKLPESKRRLIEMIRKDDPLLSKRKVLVVDDDVRNIFAITAALESHNMEVVHAESGQGGIDLLNQKSDVDVVLMDVMMPEMDGYEAIRRIRAHERFKKLPIIAVTAKAMKGDRERCLQAGASDYITKPVDMDQLRSLLRVWLYR